MSAVIDVRDVSVTHPDGDQTVHALAAVTLMAAAGEVVLVTGPSGSGKSTLVNVLAGLQPFDTGSVTVAHVDLGSATQADLAGLRLHHVGVVFQDNNLIHEFSARENVELPLRARGRKPAAARGEAERMLDAVGLSGLSERRPSRLSGGQRQRVGIARALVGGRSVLLADEPTGALDSVNASAVFDLLRWFADDGVCVVVASHDHAAERIADRHLEMRDGRISIVGER